MPAVAFYCVADSRHFPGAVALLNSLRLVGHREPFVVLDAGLAPDQRERLSRHAEVLPAPPGGHPVLLKWVAPIGRPSRVTVIVDADVVLVRSVASLLSQAAKGSIVAFADQHPDRYSPRWGEFVGPGPGRRQPYVNAGFLVLPEGIGRQALERVADAQSRIDLSGTRLGDADVDDPFYHPDQNVWNGVLSTLVQPDQLTVLPYELAPHAPFRGVELEDARSLACRYPDGAMPYLLHHIQRKPWLSPTRANAYSRLLPRLLLASDLELRLEQTELPLRFREGILASVERLRAETYAVAREQRGRLGVRRRVGAAMGDLAGARRDRRLAEVGAQPEPLRSLSGLSSRSAQAGQKTTSSRSPTS